MTTIRLLEDMRIYLIEIFKRYPRSIIHFGILFKRRNWGNLDNSSYRSREGRIYVLNTRKEIYMISRRTLT